jgi:hypothetical protein
LTTVVVRACRPKRATRPGPNGSIRTDHELAPTTRCEQSELAG